MSPLRTGERVGMAAWPGLESITLVLASHMSQRMVTTS